MGFDKCLECSIYYHGQVVVWFNLLQKFTHVIFLQLDPLLTHSSWQSLTSSRQNALKLTVCGLWDLNFLKISTMNLRFISITGQGSSMFFCAVE